MKHLRNTKVSGHDGINIKVLMKQWEERAVRNKDKWEKRFSEAESLINGFGMSPEEKRWFIVKLAKKLNVMPDKSDKKENLNSPIDNEMLNFFMSNLKTLKEESNDFAEKCIELQEKLYYAIEIIKKIRRERCDFCANKSPIGSEECKVCIQVSKEHSFWRFNEEFLTVEGYKKWVQKCI